MNLLRQKQIVKQIDFGGMFRRIGEPGLRDRVPADIQQEMILGTRE